MISDHFKYMNYYGYNKGYQYIYDKDKYGFEHLKSIHAEYQEDNKIKIKEFEVTYNNYPDRMLVLDKGCRNYNEGGRKEISLKHGYQIMELLDYFEFTKDYKNFINWIIKEPSCINWVNSGEIYIKNDSICLNHDSNCVYDGCEMLEIIDILKNPYHLRWKNINGENNVL